MTDALPHAPQVALVTGAGSGIGRSIALALARTGYIAYAGMRAIDSRNRERAEQMRSLADREHLTLIPTEIDVLSEESCRLAVERISVERGRLDIVVNNAGMLMSGPAETFTAEQFLQILDTNAVSWLRVNRAVLPVMRSQGRGLLVYVSSTTAHLVEPLIGIYEASKAAGDALAEAMALEVRPFGIETLIILPGAFTDGTEHFADARAGADEAVTPRYARLMERANILPQRIQQIDAQVGAGLIVEDVGKSLVDTLLLSSGDRPMHLVIDGQDKGVEQTIATKKETQQRFLAALGFDYLLTERH